MYIFEVELKTLKNERLGAIFQILGVSTHHRQRKKRAECCGKIASCAQATTPPLLCMKGYYYLLTQTFFLTGVQKLSLWITCDRRYSAKLYRKYPWRLFMPYRRSRSVAYPTSFTRMSAWLTPLNCYGSCKFGNLHQLRMLMCLCTLLRNVE